MLVYCFQALGDNQDRTYFEHGMMNCASILVRHKSPNKTSHEAPLFRSRDAKELVSSDAYFPQQESDSSNVILEGQSGKVILLHISPRALHGLILKNRIEGSVFYGLW